MARRKDHDPKTLRLLIVRAGRTIIQAKGLEAMTARSVARAVGYAPGTIYNVFRDLDALTLAINHETLDLLQQTCEAAIEGVPDGMPRIKALAHTYLHFAETHARLWSALFAQNRRKGRGRKPPVWYRRKLDALFILLERNLQQAFGLPAVASRQDARLLWACMHGITSLQLDGRLGLAGVADAAAITDAMLMRLFGGSAS